MKKILLCLMAALLSLGLWAQSKKTVSGIVFDDTGQAVQGVAVYVFGSQNGTVTDADGKFSLLAGKTDVIIFSCLGYEDQKVPVDNWKMMNVILRTSTNYLQETVVIGYGSSKKSDLTGAVEVVNMDKISSPGTLSADKALQGRIAGLEVVSAGGEPGAGSSIRIRGNRSITASNEPLVVVDGIMDAVSSFSDINPDDIKNITVLKDASSTAIYGSRGSNGVILVTTRDGGSEKLKVSFGLTGGFSHLLRKLDVMDATEYARYRNDYGILAGKGIIFPEPEIFGKGTDWQESLTRTGYTASAKLSIAHNDAKNNVLFTFGYDNTGGIILNSDMNRYTTLLKLKHKFSNNFTAGANINFTYRHNNLSKVKLNGTSSSAVCNIVPLVGLEDEWNRYGDSGNGGTVFDSPYLVSMKTTNYSNVTVFGITPWVEIVIARTLKLRSDFSYTSNITDTWYYSPGDLSVAKHKKLGGKATQTGYDKTNLLSETTLTWNKKFQKQHSLSLMAGFTAQQNNRQYNSEGGTGYLDDQVGPNNLSGIYDLRNLVVRSHKDVTKRMSVLGRANYGYKSRYNATVTVRADGSSNFAEGHKWAVFPAGAFKWTLSNEKWMKQAKYKGLSNLALRISVGSSGNDAIPSYVSQSILEGSASGYLFGEEKLLGYSPTRLDNNSLTWEKTLSGNVGIDVSLFGDRLKMTADAYLSRTTDLLLLVQNSQTTGYSNRYDNVGDTRGWGAEFSLTSRNISKRNFFWETNFTISHNSSVVTDLGIGYEEVSTLNVGQFMAMGMKKGYPINSLWGLQYCGVWHNDQERAENKITRTYVSYVDKNGYSKYADVNHDGTVDKNDVVYLGTTDPIVQGGFDNNFRIGKLAIDLYFTYSIGGKMYNISETVLGTSSTIANKYRYMSGCWSAERPDSDLPSAYSVDSYGCDRFVHDSSFLRLKTLSVSYAFDLTKKIKWLSSIELGAHADNLFLITGYNGYDPEVTSSSTISRLDTSTYPTPRSFTFSLKFRY